LEGTSLLAHHILKYRKRCPCSTLSNNRRVHTAGSVTSECFHQESNELSLPQILQTIRAYSVCCVGMLNMQFR